MTPWQRDDFIMRLNEFNRQQQAEQQKLEAEMRSSH